MFQEYNKKQNLLTFNFCLVCVMQNHFIEFGRLNKLRKLHQEA